MMRGVALKICASVVLLLAAQPGNASSTWSGASDSTDNWSDSANWIGGVPATDADVTFTGGAARLTNYDDLASLSVASITFDEQASAYTIHVLSSKALTFSGIGLANLGSNSQTLVAEQAASIGFTNSASAGNSRIELRPSNGTIFGGILAFSKNASAGQATLVNAGNANPNSYGGETLFRDASTAAGALIINAGGTSTYGPISAMTFFSQTANAGTSIIQNKSGAVVSGPGGKTEFDHNSSASNAMIMNEGAQATGLFPGGTTFKDSSSAGSAFITNTGIASTSQIEEGILEFYGNSTAAYATITNAGGVTRFNNSATAGQCTITNEGTAANNFFAAGQTIFFQTSSAGNATLVAHGGEMFGGCFAFLSGASGGTARTITEGNGSFEIGGAFTIGSVEGDGQFYLSGATLSIGSNNLSTTFSGTLHDGGFHYFSGSGGSLRKVGSGNLTLSGRNTYTGLTTILSGGLTIASGGSIAGSAEVQGGGLTIDGFISGNVTVRANALLRGSGTINGNLIIDAGGAVELDGSTLTLGGKVLNNGRITLKHGSEFDAHGSSFINNGVLDLITNNGFVTPTGFVNNGAILDSSIVVVKTLSLAHGVLSLVVDSNSGHSYQLQAADALAPDAFTNLAAPKSGVTGITLTFSDPSATVLLRYYRIVLDPPT